MNTKNLVTVFAFIVCIGFICDVLVQRRELITLRAKQQRLAVPQSSPAKPSPDVAVDASSPVIKAGALGDVSSEVLRLRSQVTRLSARKRELAAAPGTVESLRAQVASSMTNTPAGIRLPPGYIRKNQARMVGYDTPENTVQSFLWALQNRDSEKLAQALTPEAAERFQASIRQAGSTEDLFKNDLVGWRIKSQEQLPDGALLLQMEIFPGMPAQKLRLQQVDGQWKMSEPF